MARPYYLEEGPNSWQHIQEVRRRASKMAHKLYGRGLTPEEYAAVMLHDSTKLEFGGKNHGRMGADRAAKLLAVANLMTPEQNRLAEDAIRVHDDNLREFPSGTAELLASADANPPDLDWVLNKSWCHNMKGGRTREEAYDAVYNGPIRTKYGTNGDFNYPGVYRQYYGDDAIAAYQKALDELTQPEMRARLAAYHKKYGIDPDNPHVIHNR